MIVDYNTLAESYIDASGLMAPSVVPVPKPIKSSDNGTMFLSEYHILLELLDQSLPEDKNRWEAAINGCMQEPGLLCRGADKSGAQDQQDNALGVLAAAVVLKRPAIAQSMLAYGFKHLGFFNNEVPGSFRDKAGNIDWNAFLWRMPQLFFFNLCAAGSYKWYTFWYWPLALITAFIIATATNNKPLSDADSRRLTFLAVLATKDHSTLCKLAGHFFRSSVQKDYGAEGMAGAYKQYYQSGHVLIQMMEALEAK